MATDHRVRDSCRPDPCDERGDLGRCDRGVPRRKLPEHARNNAARARGADTFGGNPAGGVRSLTANDRLPIARARAAWLAGARRSGRSDGRRFTDSVGTDLGDYGIAPTARATFTRPLP